MIGVKAQLSSTEPISKDWTATLPGEANLPSKESKMESSLHALQLRLLVTILEWHWRDRTDFFIGDNLTIYYSPRQTKTRDFRGPDFFLVTGTDPRPRKSWVEWEENNLPGLIIELLSDSTAAADRGIKKEIYQNDLRTPEYFWYSPETGEFAGFRLQEGKYQAIMPNERGWRWSETLKLYLGAEKGFLRYFTAEGEILLTPSQAAEQEAQRAEQEAQRAEQESQRAEQESQRANRLAAKLLELGIDPNTI